MTTTPHPARLCFLPNELAASGFFRGVSYALRFRIPREQQRRVQCVRWRNAEALVSINAGSLS